MAHARLRARTPKFGSRVADHIGVSNHLNAGPTIVRPTAKYRPSPNDRVLVAMPHQAGTHGTAPGVVIGEPRPGWSTVRITESPPGQPWPVIDVPNKRLRLISTPTTEEK